MPDNAYAFAVTTKVNDGLYIEDRGYPCRVERGSAAFAIVDAELGKLLSPGQTASRLEDGSWDVQEGFPMLEELRSRRLAKLHDAWLKAEADGTVQSSAGFLIDADERANRDISGLVTAMEASGVSSTTFCGADNTFHTVSLAQLKAMQLEVIAHAQALYERKWTLRTALEQAQTLEAVQAVNISFGDL